MKPQVNQSASTGQRPAYSAALPPSRNAQQGVTLFTALIFLVMLTLLGVNAAQMSGLEERMAGNSRNRDLALQAAQSALKYLLGNKATIANYIPAPTNLTPGVVIGVGLRTIDTCLPNSPDYWSGVGAPDCNGATQTFVWTASGSPLGTLVPGMTAWAALPNLAAQPQCIVERLPNLGIATRFRVTVRAVGGDPAAVVILQAIF
jgi:type IV pilus assembly protein PilX